MVGCIYKITIAYKGTDLVGWQRQPHGRSVEQIVRNSFYQAFFQHPIKLYAASRTDAGVHALGQVIYVHMHIDIPSEKLVWIWNNTLPFFITIRSAQKVDTFFNPHKNVLDKTYWYHISLSRPLPFVAPYVWHVKEPLSIKKLDLVLQQFLGTHDFKPFSSAQDSRESTIRTIQSISLSYIRRYNVYRVTVVGEKFLRHMIRRMVGACVSVATHESLSASYIQDIFSKQKPCPLLMNAPSQGLMLYKIRYKDVNDII